MPNLRTRIAVFLISLAALGLELTFMRGLALRFWHHFAYMVIGVAILGFGASGTAVALLRRWMAGRERACCVGAALLFALSAPLTSWVSRCVPLNVQFLAWELSRQALNVLLVELLMFVPFFFAGAAICIALMDRPERIGGHYAANLAGSGVGALAVVLLMHFLDLHALQFVMTCAGFLGGAVLVPWRRRAPAFAGVLACVATVAACLLMPKRPLMSQYKMLSAARLMPDFEVIHRDVGPLGRLDVVNAPSLHYSPGVGMRYMASPPPHVLMILDGDRTSAVYDVARREDWAFMDHTTAASAYYLRSPRSALIIGAGGGAGIGLAEFHGCEQVTALEVNDEIVDAITGPLKARGGRIYEAAGVTVLQREARGFFATTDKQFDVIQLPPIDALGASGSGMYAAQESYLYTVEAFTAMLDALGPNGVVCITRWARTPPRDGLRVFDTAAAALREMDLDPRARLAMVRNWATVSILVTRQALAETDCGRLREFCETRGFDVCYLPRIQPTEANRFHVLDRAYFHEGALALLDDRGMGREEFLAQYPFSIEAATDDRPYFHHFFRWRALKELRRQMGGRAPAFLELGYLMLIAALAQSALLAIVLIVVPLIPGVRSLSECRGRATTFGYFLCLGVGFMLLEMGFLQRFVLYLAQPIYAAVAAISSFLIFGGIGSRLSARWRRPFHELAPRVGAAIVGVSFVYLFALGPWLALTQGWPVWARFAIAGVTIAPLAVAMGHMFPLGLREVGRTAPALVAWAWAINGSASVVAAVAAPLLAMHVGFAWITILAAICYAGAALLARGGSAAPVEPQATG